MSSRHRRRPETARPTAPTRRRLPLLLLCLALGALGALLPASAMAAFIRVTHFVDDFDDDNGTCTLREAIRSANLNGPEGVDACSRGLATQVDQVILPAGTHVVQLGPGTSLEDEGFTGDLDIHDRVVIRGVAPDLTVIEGVGAPVSDRLFEVHAGVEEVEIERLSLRNGAAPSGGLVRVHAGADVTLHETDLSGGFAFTGGGVHNAGTLSILESRVHANQLIGDSDATTGGGGIANLGSGSLTVIDSELVGNGSDGVGGGIQHSGGALVVHRSHLEGNGAADGGALYTNGLNASVDFSSFEANRASRGAGIYAAAPIEIQHSALIGNVATVAGGGLYDAGDSFLRFSTITANEAPTGAGVHAAAGQTLLDANTIAVNAGHGVFNESGAFFENTIVADNVAGNCAGVAPAFGAFNLEDADTCGFVSGPTGPNLPNTDPLLGLLGDHGGPTKTFPLLPGSPAIDAVSSEIRLNCQNMLDQRGHARGRPRIQSPSGDDVFLCDIGAFERTTPFVVDTLADAPDADPDDDRCATASGDCSLRAAIQQANETFGLEEIVLGPGTHALTVAGLDEDSAATGDLDIRPPLRLRGAGRELTTIDADGLDRVLDVSPTEYLRPESGLTQTTWIQDLGLTGGDPDDGFGGGLRAARPVVLERVSIRENTAAQASGLYAFRNQPRVELWDSLVIGNLGDRGVVAAEAHIERSALALNGDGPFNGGAGEFTRLRLVDSTVSGNRAAATGAIFASEAIIEGSAIVGNRADFSPGGVFLLEQTVFRNSVIADNTVGGVVDNCSLNSGAVVSLGFNVTDTDASDCPLDAGSDRTLTDPLLDALAEDPFGTLSHEPLPGSPLIDGGDPEICSGFDQRGLLRPADGDGDGTAICDIGPIEVPEPGLGLGLAAGVAWLARRGRSRSGPGSHRQ